MTSPFTTPPGAPGATAHEEHDLELLAALADRDADPEARAAAHALTSTCATCAAIAADLRSIATALAGLPVAMPAPRDMRITPEEASRLRRGATLRRLLRPFASGGFGALRPVGAALTALGLAGILLSAGPIQLASPASVAAPLGPTSLTNGGGTQPESGGGVKAPTDVDTAGESPAAYGNQGGGAVAAASAAPSPPSVPFPSAAPRAGGQTGSESARGGGPGATTPPEAAGPVDESGGGPGSVPGLAPQGQTQGTGIPALTWLSAGVLVAGLALLGLRFAARRAG